MLILRKALSAVVGFGVLTPIAIAGSAVEEGKKIATDRRKGNCMACHVVGDASLPGWDATQANRTR
ncbi:MAG: hypothetical protein ACR2RB_06100 [Gammaproteobacteria bacterium]